MTTTLYELLRDFKMSVMLRRCLIDLHASAIRNGRYRLSPMHVYGIEDPIPIQDVRACLCYYKSEFDADVSTDAVCMLSELLWILEAAGEPIGRCEERVSSSCREASRTRCAFSC